MITTTIELHAYTYKPRGKVCMNGLCKQWDREGCDCSAHPRIDAILT